MSAPQIKERPASLLRAMFAGFGSLMSVMDKVRSKPAAEAPPAATTTPAPDETATPGGTTATAATTAPADAAAPEAVTTQTAEPETSAAPEAAPSAAVAPEAPAEPRAATEPETPAAPAAGAVSEAVTVAATGAPADEASGELPLANYDDLTVASLRARLRNLSNDDLNRLMAYEQGHQNRPEVVKMFQNRLLKVTSSLPKLEA